VPIKAKKLYVRSSIVYTQLTARHTRVGFHTRKGGVLIRETIPRPQSVTAVTQRLLVAAQCHRICVQLVSSRGATSANTRRMHVYGLRLKNSFAGAATSVSCEIKI